MARALAGLPALREGVTSGEVSWSVARRAVAFASAERDAAFGAALRGRTVKAAQALLRAAFGSTAEARAHEDEKAEADQEEEEKKSGHCAKQDEARGERVLVRVPLAREHHGRWQAALELARRMAGEALPVWECAETMAAEVLSALPPARIAEAAQALQADPSTSMHRGGERPTCIPNPEAGTAGEHGLRHAAFPILRWDPSGSGTPLDLEAVRAWTEAASPHALDRALRRANARLQAIDHDLGHVLRQVIDRKLHVELGFGSFERYVQERADVSPRTARRWVQMARLAPVGSAVSEALRSGALTPKQASLVSQAVALADQAAIVEHARGVTLRRLEDALGGLLPEQTACRGRAPEALVFALGLRASGPPLLRAASGDVILRARRG